jgi:hypothetical protein
VAGIEYGFVIIKRINEILKAPKKIVVDVGYSICDEFRSCVFRKRRKNNRTAAAEVWIKYGTL